MKIAVKNSNVAKVDPLLLAEAREIAHGRFAANTRRAYQSDFRDFAQFCRDNDLEFLPAAPETVVLYLTFLARHARWSTIKRRVAAINVIHAVKCHPSPIDQTVKDYKESVKRKVGAKVEQKQALLLDDVKRILALTPEGIKGARDRAMILFAFTTWLRAENLHNLKFEDIAFLRDGLSVKVRKEKQDQARKGREIIIEYGKNTETCPVENLKQWLAMAGIQSGCVFRSVDRHGNVNGSISYDGILKILKKYALLAGLNPAKIGCHSLRSGGVTQAIVGGMPVDAAKTYGDWKSAAFDGYIRRGKQIRATQYLGV